MSDYTASYCPDDNKLRLYAVSRLPRELYDQVKAAGFKWAPKQELFVAPMWTPSREDFLLTLVDEIEDEDKSLVDRAEERSERFEDYSENRAKDAERAKDGIDRLLGHVPSNAPHMRQESRPAHVGLHRVTPTTAGNAIVSDVPKGAISPVDSIVGETAVMPVRARAQFSPDLSGGGPAVVATPGGENEKLITGEIESSAATTSTLAVNAENLSSGGKPNGASAGIVSLAAPGVPSTHLKLAPEEMIPSLNDDQPASITSALPLRSSPTPARSLSQNRHQPEILVREIIQSVDHAPRIPQILVGHHSERHARRDAKRIENGMRRAVNMWKQSEYWTRRAEGAIRHAKYKELPAVRARRIKGLEADWRKQTKNRDQAIELLAAWESVETIEHARIFSGRTEGGRLNCIKREDGFYWSAYDVLCSDENRYKACPAMTLEQVKDCARYAYPRQAARADRWIEHYENRLAYERAMLAEAGGIVTDRKGPEKGGAVRCWASPGYGRGWSYIQKVNKVSVSVLDNWGNPADLEGGRNFSRTIPFDKLKAVMTAAEVQAACAAGELHDLPSKIGFYLSQPVESRDEASARVHREAVAAAGGSCTCKDCSVDAKIDEAVTPIKAESEPAKLKSADFEAMQASLKTGVQVVSAPQLFPTPAVVAQRMVDLADVWCTQRTLEPSAGTGAILELLTGKTAKAPVAVEINQALASALSERWPGVDVRCADFLECNGDLGKFDRIVMNPPFVNGADVKHIQHARTLLAPGGRLVALCANGPRQKAALEPISDLWEELPAGSFKEQGTNVNVALLVINAPAEQAPRTTLFD